MFKVLLTNPPWTKKGFYAVRAGSRWPHFEEETMQYMPFPFFLAHATAWLEKHGIYPKLLDCLALKMEHEEFYQRVKALDPDLIAMEVSSFSMENDLHIARRLKQERSSRTIVFMGLASEMQKEEFVRANPAVSYFLVGEYEETLLELVQKLEKNEAFSKLLGAAFLKPDGTFSGFERRPLAPDINIYPWPSRDQLPMYNYHDEPGNIPCPSVQMWASRGCPYKCIFCAWPQIMYGNNDYRTRDIIDLADEFEWLVSEWGFRSVYFDDDTFNVNKKRIAAFCQELTRRGLKVPWGAMSRADLVDEPLIKLMKESSLQSLKFGLESADQNAVNHMQKNLNLKKAVQNINLVHNYGIRTHLTFMFGLPGETKETAQATLDLALKLNPWSLQMTVAAPFPGSKFMDHLEKEGHLVDKVTNADGFRTSVVRTESMSAEELEEFVAYAQNRWSIHKAKQMPKAGVGYNFKRKNLASIIIPNFNGEAYIRNAVSSALAQSWSHCEVIVVDNGSSDKSREIIKSHFPEVKLLELSSNRGFSYAVNSGIKVASGEYIALLNPDAKAEPNWLQNLIQAIDEDPRVGFACGKVLNHARPELLDSAGDAITSKGRSFNIAHFNPNSGETDRRRWVPAATGAASVYRRSVLEDVGDWDEDFFLYLEDMDYSLRCQLKGYKCVYEPLAVATHIGSASTSQIPGIKTYHLSRNWFFLLVKTFPKEILRSNWFRFLGFFLYQFFYHLLISRQISSFVSGSLQGIKRARQFIPKRKAILGSKRIPDEEFVRILQFGDQNYALTRRFRARDNSSDEIRISKAKVGNA
ncbi:MAG: glycosyltransferase [Candidatus Cloacimonetes bacterium]|nr:glycosyltransferase [Candidatus Cloacimonadota bacterium]